MKKIQEIVVKLSYFGFTRTCGEVVVSECHVIPSPVNLIGCPVKCVGTANLVVKLSVTRDKATYFNTDLPTYRSHFIGDKAAAGGNEL